MRYAVLSAAVISGAFFLAPSSPMSPTGAHHVPSIFSKSAVVAKAEPQHSGPKVVLASAPAPTAAPQPVVVTVASGDSLTSLASANNTTTERLYSANPVVSDPNLIVPGQQLRVPTADEQLADRPLPIPAAVVAPITSVSASQPIVTAAVVASGSVWDQLAACESGGNWAVNTGNGFYGGLQFTAATWQSLGGSGLPSDASRDQQIALGQALQARSGWGQWPACSAKLGLL